MPHIQDHPNFWTNLDTLVATAEVIIDRPKGSRHPRFPDLVYPLDYGYLTNTTSMDQGGIDIWIGSGQQHRVEAVVCTIDMRKRDAELKILYACTPQEQQVIYALHNEAMMNGILITRGE